MTAQRKFPISYDYFKAIVALLLLLMIFWAWRNSGPPPTMSVAVDPSGVVTFSGKGKTGTVAALTLKSETGIIRKLTAEADDTGGWLASEQLEPGRYKAVVKIDGRQSAPQEFAVPKSAALSEITFEQSQDDPYLLSGQAAPESQLLVLLDGVVIDHVMTDAQGFWQYKLTATPGNHTVQLAYAEAPTVTSATATLNLPRHYYAKPKIQEIKVNEATINLSGLSDPQKTVYIWADGKLAQTALAGPDGYWSASLELPPGEHQIAVSENEDSNATNDQLVKVSINKLKESSSSDKNELQESPTPDKDELANLGGFAYVVKEGDWLTKLARDYLGSKDRYREIRRATNAKARFDPSFAIIEDDNLIYPGEKIWIPAR